MRDSNDAAIRREKQRPRPGARSSFSRFGQLHTPAPARRFLTVAARLFSSSGFRKSPRPFSELPGGSMAVRCSWDRRPRRPRGRTARSPHAARGRASSLIRVLRVPGNDLLEHFVGTRDWWQFAVLLRSHSTTPFVELLAGRRPQRRPLIPFLPGMHEPGEVLVRIALGPAGLHPFNSGTHTPLYDGCSSREHVLGLHDEERRRSRRGSGGGGAPTAGTHQATATAPGCRAATFSGSSLGEVAGGFDFDHALEGAALRNGDFRAVGGFDGPIARHPNVAILRDVDSMRGDNTIRHVIPGHNHAFATDKLHDLSAWAGLEASR